MKPDASQGFDTGLVVDELNRMAPDGVDDWGATVIVRLGRLEVRVSGSTHYGRITESAYLDTNWATDDNDPQSTIRWTLLLAYQAWVRELEQRIMAATLPNADAVHTLSHAQLKALEAKKTIQTP